ncbi:MAG: hypothetical protein JXB32_12710 [Deltaproteobacteria bacterium]|nr:hypothetical protein [Deltaproteobacteria bacterium]
MEGRWVWCALALTATLSGCAEQVSDDPSGPCVAAECLADCNAAGYLFGGCEASVCVCRTPGGDDAGTADDGDVPADRAAETETAADAEADADVADETSRWDAGDDDADAGTDRTDTGGCLAELGGACNLVLQCGCGAGQRCVLGGYAEECVPDGTLPEGASCSYSDDCSAGKMCLPGLDDEPICMQFCYHDADCPAGRMCLLPLIDGVGYMVCSPPGDGCDPFTAAGCASGDGCLVMPGGPDTAYCLPAGRVPPGGDCSYDGCMVGSGCYAADPYGAPACLQYCDLAGGAPDCSAVPGATCEDALGSWPVGVCWSDF